MPTQKNFVSTRNLSTNTFKKNPAKGGIPANLKSLMLKNRDIFILSLAIKAIIFTDVLFPSFREYTTGTKMIEYTIK